MFYDMADVISNKSALEGSSMNGSSWRTSMRCSSRVQLLWPRPNSRGNPPSDSGGGAPLFPLLSR